MVNSEEIKTVIKQAAIKAAKLAVRAMREADPPVEPHTRRSIPEEKHRPKTRPMLSKPVFNWKAPDRYVELLHFAVEVTNMLQAKVYELNEEERVVIIKNWSGRVGLQFMQTLTHVETETWKSTTALFNVLKEKFRL